jgi:hypothetical protein
MDFKNKAQELFASYPEAKQLYFTSDGFAFFELPHAESHARTLSEKSVVTVNKSEETEAEPVKDKQPAPKAAKKASTAKGGKSSSEETAKQDKASNEA